MKFIELTAPDGTVMVLRADRIEYLRALTPEDGEVALAVEAGTVGGRTLIGVSGNMHVVREAIGVVLELMGVTVAR